MINNNSDNYDPVFNILNTNTENSQDYNSLLDLLDSNLEDHGDVITYFQQQVSKLTNTEQSEAALELNKNYLMILASDTTQSLDTKEDIDLYIQEVSKLIDVDNYDNLVNLSERYIKILSKPSLQIFHDLYEEDNEIEEIEELTFDTVDAVEEPEKIAQAIHNKAIVTLKQMADGTAQIELQEPYASIAQKHKIKQIVLNNLPGNNQNNTQGASQQIITQGNFQIATMTPQKANLVTKKALIFVAISHKRQEIELKKIEIEKGQAEKSQVEHSFLEKQVKHQIIPQEITAPQTTNINDSDKRDLKVRMEFIFNKFLEMLEDSQRATAERIRERLQKYREDLRRFIEKDNLMSDIKQEDINKQINNKDDLKSKLKNVFLRFF